MRCWSLAALLIAACAQPLPIHQQTWVLAQVASRYHAFYPADGDPDPARDAGLLRPRLGLPAIVQAGAPFTVELLERGSPPVPQAALVAPQVSDADARRCLAGALIAGCHLLRLAADGDQPLDGGARIGRFSARPESPPPAGGYDLYLESPSDAPTRAPRAVWLRDDDPSRLSTVRVAHLSDLHVGKAVPQLEAHLKQVFEEVNRLQPDLVIITGDIVNQGGDAQLDRRARAMLLTIEAPVAII